MGTSHAKKLFAGDCPEIELTAVCDINPTKKDWATENLNGVAFFDDAKDMYKSGLIDAVLVAIPHYDHPGYSIDAMKAGLHVMVEKPAGVYTNQVLEMNKVADECSVTFAIMMNQRTNCIERDNPERRYGCYQAYKLDNHQLVQKAGVL